MQVVLCTGVHRLRPTRSTNYRSPFRSRDWRSRPLWSSCPAEVRSNADEGHRCKTPLTTRRSTPVFTKQHW